MNLHYKSSTIINISHPCFILLTSPQPALPANPLPRFKKKKIVVKCSLWYLPGIGFRSPMDTKIHRCSNPLCINGVVQWSFVSMDSASVDSTNPRWNSACIWLSAAQKANCVHIKAGLFLA